MDGKDEVVLFVEYLRLAWRSGGCFDGREILARLIHRGLIFPRRKAFMQTLLDMDCSHPAVRSTSFSPLVLFTFFQAQY